MSVESNNKKWICMLHAFYFIFQIIHFYCILGVHEKLEIKNKQKLALHHRYSKKHCSNPLNLSALLETVL